MLGFCLRFTPQLPGYSQVGLAYYKGGCSPPPLSLSSLTLSFSLVPYCALLPSPLSPCDHGWPLLLYSLTLSAFLCLYSPLNSLPMP